MVSSWKLESSRTFHWSGRELSIMAVTGVPILPPTCAAIPDSRRMCPASAVVVVLPLVPVIPMVRPCRKGAANSTSPITLTPRARAAFSGTTSAGTPGEMTIRSQSSKTTSDCCAKGTPRRSRVAAASGICENGFRSAIATAGRWGKKGSSGSLGAGKARLPDDLPGVVDGVGGYDVHVAAPDHVMEQEPMAVGIESPAIGVVYSHHLIPVVDSLDGDINKRVGRQFQLAIGMQKEE